MEIAEKPKIMVQGLVYEEPEVPKNKQKIRGSDLPIEDQVWFRDEKYLKWDWTIDTDKGIHWYNKASVAQKLWYESEIDKLHNGCWVMINGVPTYFNKYCYFFHQWFVLLTENIYPTYKETSLEYFRFFQLCEEDPMSLGDCGIKGRRLGLSSMSSSIKLLIGMLENNTLQGIVSKTGTDAQEMYFMVKNGIENLPEFLMPDLNKVTDSEIHIAKPAKRISTNNTKLSSDKGRNNRINWLDTAENAYDGRNLRHVTVDEAGKFQKVNVQVLLTKISETLVVGASVSGHISLFSTVNKGDKGGDNFKTIWEGSDHIDGKKDMFGRTQTKMKRFFIAGYKGLLGYVGKYGESIIDTPTPEQTEYLKTYINPANGKIACPNPYIGAKRYLEESRKITAHDPELYAETVRMYPFEWKEVFKGANNQCRFNLDELNDQIECIETLLEGTGKKENGRQGKFIKNGAGDANFVDDKKGYWWILDFPEIEERNKFIRIGNIKCPNNTIYGAGGLDSFHNARATVDKGSDACIMISKRYNVLDPENSGMPVAMFIGRPSTKKEFHEQLYLGLQFYGVKLLGESSPTDWQDYAKENFLASPESHEKKIGYLITTLNSSKKNAYGAAPQSKDIAEQHLTEMIEYALNNMKKIKFLRLLKDMVGFDIANRTDYDACMAWGYSLIGLRENTGLSKPKEEPKKIVQLRHSKKYY